MNTAPKKAFVLAAGKGERMRPLTDNCPKPMLYVGGVTMLDRALDALVAAGVEEVVVNVHYLGDMIVEHLKTRTVPKITISKEDVLLDTGGGVKQALSFFGDEPFYVLNADVLWTDGDTLPTLERMAKQWDSSKMDLLLLVHTIDGLPSYMGHGDYKLDGDFGRPVFAKDGNVDPNVIFTGPRIVNPRLFDGAPDGKFSFLQLFHKAEEAGRLYALLHDGEWHHVGTPEALEKTNLHLQSKQKKIAP
jgi:MurNAc alpha-1-phosphate uridylyltransferase